MLTTKHGKGRVIGPALVVAGYEVTEVRADTDQLGTFTGDVPRPGPPLQTAIAKARLGMRVRGTAVGLASEGSFLPHPQVPWVTVDRELVVLVDDDRSLVIVGEATTLDTRSWSVAVAVDDDLTWALRGADLPQHAVIVRPDDADPDPVVRGLRHPDRVRDAVAVCAAASPTGRARVETDLRAHHSPSRRRAIATAARDLAARITTPCPACRGPGWGRTDVRTGVPCAWCGAPIAQVRAEVLGCPSCPHTETRPLVPDGAVADPGACPDCNP